MKTIFSILVVICISLACGKPKETAVIENSNQKFTGISQIINYASGNSRRWDIDYQYNNSGQIIAEGQKNYTRDENGRIIKITQPIGTVSPGDDAIGETYVTYVQATGKMVDYTKSSFSRSIGSNVPSRINFHDSTVFEHQSNRLTKIVHYGSEEDGPFGLTSYFTLTYDANNNLKQVTKYILRSGGDISCMWINDFAMYDDKINPLYSDDEVRMLELFWNYGTVSPNNVLGFKNTYYQYDYRDDGRPRSCEINEIGGLTFHLIYHYK